MFPFQVLNLFFIASKVEEEEEEEKERKYDVSVYKRGDLLEVPRTLFTHFGIYLGDNKVAHLIPDILPVFSSDEKAVRSMVTNNRLILGVITKVASVRVDSVEDFAYGAQILVNHMDKVCSRPPFSGDEVARRAEKLLGSVSYSLLWYNCEHYVMYCRYGTAISFQTYQFCKTVRKIFCSKKCAAFTALLGLGVMLYLETMSVFTALATLFVSFTIWMAS
ncbi:lecithin retinol acyltransferase-like [Scleropages formosus]|uniref:Lecithin retinol acyltransferase b, tandem duplicate 2 n=1 Tax=Scleropages formosus TaxID=113540 RepID=A0A0P7ULY7_SCLFO|nr:lecithin retinol acyltransferase-like [Scleropages formosus]KPP69724.1 lecithin retinol acyltransferase-like [Scleropages formosus]